MVTLKSQYTTALLFIVLGTTCYFSPACSMINNNAKKESMNIKYILQGFSHISLHDNVNSNVKGNTDVFIPKKRTFDLTKNKSHLEKNVSLFTKQRLQRKKKQQDFLKTEERKEEENFLLKEINSLLFQNKITINEKIKKNLITSIHTYSHKIYLENFPLKNAVLNIIKTFTENTDIVLNKKEIQIIYTLIQNILISTEVWFKNSK